MTTPRDEFEAALSEYLALHISRDELLAAADKYAEERVKEQLSEVKQWLEELVSIQNTSPFTGSSAMPDQHRRQIVTRIAWIDAKMAELNQKEKKENG